MKTETLLAPIIRLVDRILRRRQGIFEFDDDARCIFRLSVHPFECAHDWPDGTHTGAGTLVGEVHLWNEHLAGGASLRSRFNYSMRALARVIAADPELNRLPGFHAESWVPVNRRVARAFQWGFQIDSKSDKFEFWDQLYFRLLTRTFNPGAPRGPLRRVRIWISRDEVIRRFGDSPAVLDLGAEDSQRRLTAGG